VSGRPATPVLLSQPHRRFDALSGEWLLVSSERTSRPWLGIEERPPAGALPTYEPSCYLCPGNTRANGQRNPDYESTFVFTNDFAALRPDSPAASYKDGLLWAESERGRCLVICFSPRHDLTISHMNAAQARVVVDLWATQSASSASPSSGFRSSRIEAPPWERRTRTRTDRSGRAALFREKPRRRTQLSAALRGDRAQSSARLRRAGSGRTEGSRKRRRLADRGPVLGRLALRDAGHPPQARVPASGP